jgi:GMP synthase (glutamine-hydrolysing)
MKDLILVVENYPGRGDCIIRLLRQFDVPFELVTSDGGALILPPRAAGVILSGGPQSVTKISSEEGIRLRPVLKLLDEAERMRLPVLGICLGHQLLGTWAGGKVAKLPAKVIGFKEVNVQRRSNIFESLGGENVLTFQYHEDHLRDLPDNCEVIATSETCEVEAFRLRGRMMWGVQFHPEVTRSDGEAIFDGQPPPLRPWESKFDVKGPYIIKDFAEICVRSPKSVLV